MLVPLFLGGAPAERARSAYDGCELSRYPLRRDSSPVGVGHAVLGVGATIAYFFENHGGAFSGMGRLGGTCNRGVLKK